MPEFNHTETTATSQTGRFVTGLANFFSFVFSPLLVPTYGVALALWFSVLTFIPLEIKWRVIGLTFGLTAVVPALVVALLKWKGYVSDMGLNNQKERPVPYAVVCLTYLLLAWCFRTAHFPEWICLFMCGAALATEISLIVNVWWKISAHLAAMGGLIGLMLRIVADLDGVGNVLAVTLTVILAAGLVGSSRVWLGRHTVGQVFAGALNGALCVYIISGL